MASTHFEQECWNMIEPKYLLDWCKRNPRRRTEIGRKENMEDKIIFYNYYSKVTNTSNSTDLRNK
jgi:hypothetical protein